MTFYNIRRSREFFEKLSECDGKVDIVGENGSTVEYLNNNKNITECFDGMIRRIEIRLHTPEDINRMMNFMINEKRSA